MATNVPVTLDTLITVKISIQGSNRKFKIPLRDLGANVLPDKLRLLLSIPANQEVVFERFSDSAGAYITLDSANPQVYKTLFRAAKAKLKLRLRATVVSPTEQPTTSEPKTSFTAPNPVIDKAPAVALAPALAPLPVPSGPTQTTQSSPPVRPASYTYFGAGLPTAQVPYVPVHTATGPPAPYNYNSFGRVPAFSKSMADLKKPTHTPQPPSVLKAGLDAESLRDSFVADISNISRERSLAFRMKEPPVAAWRSWSVYCNECDKPMANEHFHCSICDDGDYDLCAPCVDTGIHCPGEGHWLIKRFVQDGKVINSTTEKVAPRPKEEPANEKEMPGAFTEGEKKLEQILSVPTRTCNSCVKVLPESEFVTCMDCDDYDLCVPCHVGTKHGHHPGHAFKPATEDTAIGPLAEFLCAPGRNVRHAAVCDGCDKFIYGVRNKCLNCPDWDYCSKCIKNAKYIHPHHRFVPIYEPLPEPRLSMVRHYGIYCDGPLCKDRENQSYIEGVRYKCAVCHDTDFCANCEALPTSRHNRTHPLIKFKTPVRNVSVTTMGEDKNGVSMATMGDQPPRKSASTETTPISTANAATEVQTIVDLKPSEEPAVKSSKEKIEIKDLLAEPIQERVKINDLLATPNIEDTVVDSPRSSDHPSKQVLSVGLNAHFIRDTVTDGTQMAACTPFTQVWTLRNPGPQAWPAGCSVKYVGGDNMLNVDDNHPSSATDIAAATESNILPRDVEVGEEFEFQVSMRAPKRAGVAISYWRLKAPDGTPFGHRLWCHIDVRNDHDQYLADYQMQLMLLERQNQKRRLLVQMAHAAAEEGEKGTKTSEHVVDENVASVPEPVVEKQEQALDGAKEPKPEVLNSGMVFPQLDKESPASSTHEATIETNTAAPKSEPLQIAPSEADSLEIFEDAESVEIMDASSDDGFLTDEEYDILDASDDEVA